MFAKKPEKSPEDFWREYEEKTCEKVLSRGLGKYLSGWDEFDKKKQNNIWGLIITTSGGFRFHHFPQRSIFDALTTFAATETPKEKTIFIPQNKIIATDEFKETKWWKKIFSFSTPRIVIKYTDDDDGKEKQLVFEAEYTHRNIT